MTCFHEKNTPISQRDGINGARGARPPKFPVPEIPSKYQESRFPDVLAAAEELQLSKRKILIISTACISATLFLVEAALVWGDALGSSGLIHWAVLIGQVVLFVRMQMRLDKLQAIPVSIARRICGLLGIGLGAMALHLAVQLHRSGLFVKFSEEATRLHVEDAMAIGMAAAMIGLPLLCFGFTLSMFAGDERLNTTVGLNVLAGVVGFAAVLAGY